MKAKHLIYILIIATLSSATAMASRFSGRGGSSASGFRRNSSSASSRSSRSLKAPSRSPASRSLSKPSATRSNTSRPSSIRGSSRGAARLPTRVSRKPATPPARNRSIRVKPATPPARGAAIRRKPATPPARDTTVRRKPATPPARDTTVRRKPATPPERGAAIRRKPATPPERGAAIRRKPATPPARDTTVRRKPAVSSRPSTSYRRSSGANVKPSATVPKTKFQPAPAAQKRSATHGGDRTDTARKHPQLRRPAQTGSPNKSPVASRHSERPGGSRGGLTKPETASRSTRPIHSRRTYTKPSSIRLKRPSTKPRSPSGASGSLDSSKPRRNLKPRTSPSRYKHLRNKPNVSETGGSPRKPRRDYRPRLTPGNRAHRHHIARYRHPVHPRHWRGAYRSRSSSFSFSFSWGWGGTSLYPRYYAPYHSSWYYGGFGYPSAFYSGWRHGWHGGFSYAWNPTPIYRSYYLYEPEPIIIEQPVIIREEVIVERAPITETIVTQAAPISIASDYPADHVVVEERTTLRAAAPTETESFNATDFDPEYIYEDQFDPFYYDGDLIIEEFQIGFSSYASSLNPELIWLSYSKLDRAY